MVCNTLKMIIELGNKVTYMFMSLDLNTRIRREVLGAKVYQKMENDSEELGTAKTRNSKSEGMSIEIC